MQEVSDLLTFQGFKDEMMQIETLFSLFECPRELRLLLLYIYMCNSLNASNVYRKSQLSKKEKQVYRTIPSSLSSCNGFIKEVKPLKTLKY